MYTEYRFHEFGNCCSCPSCWCGELWIVLHTVKSIHSRRALTFAACVDVVPACGLMCKVTGKHISHRFPKHNAEKHFGDNRLVLHVSASA